MASTCIANCVDDSRIPARATYVNLYKWPESDAAFVRSVSSKGRLIPATSPPFIRSVSTNGRLDGPTHPRVVDSRSCRQLYLRSYTFSRKESMPQKARKCVGRVKERVVARRRMRKVPSGGHGGVVIRRAKEVSCAALTVVFRRVLSCTTKVDVVG